MHCSKTRSVTKKQRRLGGVIRFVSEMCTYRKRQQINSQQDVRLLNYDLQLLEDWVQQKSIEKVVIFLRDSEAFEGTVLSDVVDILR